MMEGTPADALRDFEHVMTVLQHGAADHYDAASFVSACAAFSAQLDPKVGCILYELTFTCPPYISSVHRALK